MQTYTPFDKMKAKLTQRPGVTDPGALAAYIARRKYGNKAVQSAAKSGSSLRYHKPLAAFVKKNGARQ